VYELGYLWAIVSFVLLIFGWILMEVGLRIGGWLTWTGFAMMVLVGVAWGVLAVIGAILAPIGVLT